MLAGPTPRERTRERQWSAPLVGSPERAVRWIWEPLLAGGTIDPPTQG